MTNEFGAQSPEELAYLARACANSTEWEAYAQWLSDRDDPRGPALHAFLAGEPLSEDVYYDDAWERVTGLWLRRCLPEAGNLEAFEAGLREVNRPCLDIRSRKAKRLAVGASRFGGQPDWPAGAPWPEWEGRASSFVAQIALADLVGSVAAVGLPQDGLLSFFYTWDMNDEVWDRSDGSFQVRYTPAGAELAPRRLPPESEATGKASALSFHEALDLPHDFDQCPGSPFPEEHRVWDRMLRLDDMLHVSEHRLLSYPAHSTLAYDPTPGPEWVSFLNLGSEDRLKWSWGDGDKLMVFVHKDDLADHSFARVKVDEG